MNKRPKLHALLAQFAEAAIELRFREEEMRRLAFEIQELAELEEENKA